MEQNEGVKSFLQKAAQKKGVEFNNDKADSLIQSYQGDYSKLITDVGRQIGIDDTTMPEFTNKARKTYGIPESTIPNGEISNQQATQIKQITNNDQELGFDETSPESNVPTQRQTQPKEQNKWAGIGKELKLIKI